MEITRISPTGLELYERCPRCFLLKMQGKKQKPTPALLFGMRLHKALEYYHKKGQIHIDEDLQPYLDEYVQIYTIPYDIIEEFWSVPLFDTGIMLITKGDLIKDNIIYEHKTSSVFYSQERVDKHRQATAYSYTFRTLYQYEEAGICFNIFNTNPPPDSHLLQILHTNRTEEDYEEWQNWVYDILLGIENDEFPPRPAPFHNYIECPLHPDHDEARQLSLLEGGEF